MDKKSSNVPQMKEQDSQAQNLSYFPKHVFPPEVSSSEQLCSLMLRNPFNFQSVVYHQFRSVNDPYFGTLDYNSCYYHGFPPSYGNFNINDQIMPFFIKKQQCGQKSQLNTAAHLNENKFLNFFHQNNALQTQKNQKNQHILLQQGQKCKVETQQTGHMIKIQPLSLKQMSPQMIKQVRTKARLIILARYKQKKLKRTYKKRIVYQCRKSVADCRVRVKGRFAKRITDTNITTDNNIQYAKQNQKQDSICK